MPRPHVTALDRAVVRLVRLQRVPLLGVVVTAVLRFLGVYIPAAVQIGAEFRLPHALVGVVVHYRTRIGDRVTLMHHVTIGRADVHETEAGDHAGAVIEDDVLIGAGAVILSRGPVPLVVGRGSVIGANSVLTRSTGPGEVWAGAPARLVGRSTPRS